MATTTTTPNKPKQSEVPVPKGEMTPPTPRSESLVPFGDFPFFLGRLRDEFDQLFGRLAQRWPGFDLSGWRWGLDVKEEEDAVVVRAEVPGFEPGDFDIQVRDNQLILKAEKKAEITGKEGPREWSRRSCHQVVTIPSGIAADRIEAKYRNGILTVTLPRTPESKGRRVAVKGE